VPALRFASLFKEEDQAIDSDEVYEDLKRDQCVSFSLIPLSILNFGVNSVILVSMTRIGKTTRLAKSPGGRRRMKDRRPGRWLLQDAKARFSELVRRVRAEGPQHVTVHGRDEVVVIAAEEYHRLQGDLTGEALLAAMQSSPHRKIDIEPRRSRMPVRDVSL
jgi:prevent-host-death family protein